MLGMSDIPRDANGTGLGRFRLRMSELTSTVPGARFVNGVTVQPVSGEVVGRLVQAFGPQLVIEPWDEAEAKAIAARLAERGNEVRASAVLEASALLFRRKRKGKNAA